MFHYIPSVKEVMFYPAFIWLSCFLSVCQLPHVKILSVCGQWRRQLWRTGARAPSISNNFIFSSLWSKSESQLVCVLADADVNN